MPSRTARCLEHPREWRYVPRLVHHIPAAIHARSGFMARLGNQLISLLINAPAIAPMRVLSRTCFIVDRRALFSGSLLDRFVRFCVILRLIALRSRSSIALHFSWDDARYSVYSSRRNRMNVYSRTFTITIIIAVTLLRSFTEEMEGIGKQKRPML